MDGKAILKVPMLENDGEADTIHDYLKKLLTQLWADGESFSGKRPFGNSGWEYELYKALVMVGAVKGKLDGDGYIEDVDTTAANKLIFSAIKAL